MILSIFLVVLAYLMGSICSAVIVCKASDLPDPRAQGSKNPGATNVLRIAGKKYAVIVLFADLLKGTIPVVIAKMLGADPVTVGFAALAAVVGHMYPAFFNFKGGKGVATAIGALLGFQFIVGSMVVATWLVVARLSRYSSLASIIAIGMAPLYSLLIIGRIEIFPPIFFMAVLILIKHRHNIGRLIDGTEPKIKIKQTNVIEEIMDDEPSIRPSQPAPSELAAIEAAKAATKETVKAAKKETAVKTKTVKKPITKPAPKKASTVETSEKKTKPAKKPTTPKAKANKPKEE